MVDITAKLILYRLNESWSNMADRIDKLVYIDESKEMVDILNILLFGWIVVGILVYVIGTLVANRLGKRQATSGDAASTPGVDEPEGTTPEGGRQLPNGSPTGKAKSAGLLRGAPGDPTAAFPVHASGPDPDAVLWTNKVIAWLYALRDPKLVTEPWVQALNEKVSKTTSKHGIKVEFEGVHPDSKAPELYNVHTELESKESLTTTAGIKIQQLILVIKVTSGTGHEATVNRYNLVIEKLDGKLKICCINTELLLIVRFLQPPEVRVTLKPCDGESKPHSVDQRALDDAIIETVIEALKSSVVDLNFSGQKDFPSFQHREPVKEIVQDAHIQTVNSSPSIIEHDQRILVKIIKASNLGGKKGCKEAHCIVELDDPPQRFVTSTIKETCNPFWDEHYLFNVDNNSSEVLFEIYDRSRQTGDDFLGLGIVSIEELKRIPSQRQIISLQSRPLEYDDISGSLTVEFLFMEGSKVPVSADSPTRTEFSQELGASKSRIVEKNSRVTAGGTVITTTTIKRSPTAEKETGDEEQEALHAIEEKLKLIKSREQAKSVEDLLTKFLMNSGLNKSEGTKASNEVFNDITKTDDISNKSVSKEEPLMNGDLPHADVRPLTNGFDGLDEGAFKEEPRTNGSLPQATIKPLTSVSESNIHTLPVYNFRPITDNASAYPENGMDKPKGQTKLGLSSFGKVPNGAAYTMPKFVPAPVIPPPPFPPRLFEPSNVSSVPQNHKGNESPTISDKSFGSQASATPRNTPRPTVTTIRITSSQSFSDKDGSITPKPILTTDFDEIEVVTQDKGIHNQTPSPTSLNVSTATTNNSDTSTYMNGGSMPFDIPILQYEPVALKGRSATLPRASKNGMAKQDDGGSLTEAALQELESKGRSPSSTSKSTLIIHSVHKSDDASRSASPSSPRRQGRHPAAGSASSSCSEVEEAPPKAKEKKPSIFGTLRKRLSFRKKRSKSMEARSDGEAQSRASSRSVSADRSKSVPAGRNAHLGVPGVADNGSTRSSISEASGLSAASSRTYVSDKSLLVVEANENGVIKHYLVPPSLANRSKWRKKGAKLHIYNDHTFVAKHLSGSVPCTVCGKLLSRRPGKQGYMCRDCDLQCHKICHVKVESFCPNSTVTSMQMEQVEDHRAKKLKSS